MLSPPSHASGLRRGLGVLTLTGTIFIFISSGPFGLEAMVRESGPGAAPLMLVLALLFWGLSHALVASELSSAIPVQGGFFRWIGMAFGEFWGFQAGWWYWIKMLADTAIYPILFSQYLKYWIPGMEPWQERLVRVVLIWVFVGINLRGIRTGGRLAIAFTIFMMTPFLFFIILGAPSFSLEAFRPLVTEHNGTLQALGLGLMFGMWCYNTLDSVSIVAEEVEAPRKTYVRAYSLAIPLIFLAYFLPIVIATSVDPDYGAWTDHHFTTLGFRLGGEWLGTWIALGALASNLSIFHGALMVNTRVPMVLAARRQFPAPFASLGKRFGTPWFALLFDGCVYTVIALMVERFTDIVVSIQWLNSGIYTLLYLSFLTLRWKRPDLPRPFRIPGGWAGALAICTGPFLVCWIGVPLGAMSYLWIGLLALLSGPIAWLVMRGMLGPARGGSEAGCGRS
jgi:amino acid transporter